MPARVGRSFTCQHGVRTCQVQWTLSHVKRSMTVIAPPFHFRPPNSCTDAPIHLNLRESSAHSPHCWLSPILRRYVPLDDIKMSAQVDVHVTEGYRMICTMTKAAGARQACSEACMDLSQSRRSYDNLQSASRTTTASRRVASRHGPFLRR